MRRRQGCGGQRQQCCSPHQIQGLLHHSPAGSRGLQPGLQPSSCLVIDSAERLAGQPVLEELLEASRGWADQGLVRLVLVTSDKSFVKQLQSESPFTFILGLHAFEVSVNCCYSQAKDPCKQ